MTEQSIWHEWDLTGLSITQLRFDASVHIHMWSLSRDLMVVFGCPISLRTPNNTAILLDPEQHNTLGPLLSLLGRPALSFKASSHGPCLLRLLDGTEVACEPHNDYEAWESEGSGDLCSASLLCEPGGVVTFHKVA